MLLCKGLLSNYYVNSSRMENAVNTFSIRSTQNYFSLLNLDSVLVRCISHLFYKISPVFFNNFIHTISPKIHHNLYYRQYNVARLVGEASIQ